MDTALHPPYQRGAIKPPSPVPPAPAGTALGTFFPGLPPLAIYSRSPTSIFPGCLYLAGQQNTLQHKNEQAPFWCKFHGVSSWQPLQRKSPGLFSARNPLCDPASPEFSTRNGPPVENPGGPFKTSDSISIRWTPAPAESLLPGWCQDDRRPAPGTSRCPRWWRCLPQP